MELTKEKAKENLSRLIVKFDKELSSGRIKEYNEEAAKISFIQPLLKEVLGWDVNDRNEVSPEEKISRGRVDYGLKVEGKIKIFIEAKPPRADLSKHVEQAVRYGYNRKGVPFVLLTDFEDLKLFDVTVKPDARNPLKGLKIDLSWEEFLPKFEKLWLLSKESVVKGELDKLLLVKPKERLPVDKAILDDLKRWREILAKDIFKNNPDLFHSGDSEKDAVYLKEITQRILDRIIFMRSCEDRGLIYRRPLKELFEERTETVGTNTMIFLKEEFKHYNINFNSDLFRPQEWEDNLAIDFKVMKDVVLETYNPYQFDVIPLEVLGNIYEQYLGYTIRLTDHQVKYELKPELRKAGGVYYTPEYIVDYIVKNTVGRLLKESSPRKIKRLRILDPACGSGSFLIRAYEEMLSYYQEEKERRRKSKHEQTKLDFKQEEDKPQLTIQEKSEILRNHIFGVDIDEQAVEVTKLSLMLKMLEGEYSFIPGRAILPMLDKNIKCGNSLISGDTLELKKYFGDDWYKVKPFNWEDEFRVIMKEQGGFDVVIGNPPWGAEFCFEEKKYFMERFEEIHMRTPDSFNYFLGLGALLIKKFGIIGMIIPNNFLFQHEYAKSRKFFVNKLWLQKAINLGDNVFEVTAPSCVVIIRKDKSNIRKITHISDLRNIDREYLPSFTKNIFYDSVEAKAILSYPDFVIPMNREAAEIIERILSEVNELLGDLSIEIAAGIGTGGDKIFRIENNLVKRLCIEKDIVHPVLVGRDINAYYTPENSEFSIIYSTKSISTRSHPKTLDYLRKFQIALSQKRETKKGLIPWWSLHWPRYPELFSPPKIVLRQTADSIYASIDTKGFYCLNSIIIIKPKNPRLIFYLTGLLNSKLIRWLYRNLTQELNRVFAEVKPINLRKLPIYIADFSNSRDNNLYDNLIALVDVQLELNKKIKIAKGSEKERIQRQIDKADREIDDIVYELYGITEEERKIIEQETEEKKIFS
jgi:type I restriction-modification system DNA methylase subunit